MKKFFGIIFGLLLGVSCCFAEHPSIKVDDNGNHTYETTISHLFCNGFKDEVCIQNGSSYTLKNIQCTIVMNNVYHKLLPISKVETGDDDNFDGLEDDEMHDEFPYYFGSSGKFKADNFNKIKFIIKFSDNNNKVVISDIQFRDHDLYFYVENDPNAKVTEQVVEDSVRVIVIDGHKYMIIGKNVVEVKDE